MQSEVELSHQASLFFPSLMQYDYITFIDLIILFIKILVIQLIHANMLINIKRIRRELLWWRSG